MARPAAAQEIHPGSWINVVSECAPELLPHHNDKYPGGNVVVIGSFKGWKTDIVPIRERLRAAGFFPLAPHGNEIVDYAGADGAFEVVDEDAGSIALMEERLGRVLSKAETANFLEALFCAAIKESDFVYVAALPREDISDGGYIGLQVALELGIAQRNGPVYGVAISPSLDHDIEDRWTVPHYLRWLTEISPEELGARYAAGEKL
jgi:hypothetical protein